MGIMRDAKMKVLIGVTSWVLFVASLVCRSTSERDLYGRIPAAVEGRCGSAKKRKCDLQAIARPVNFVIGLFDGIAVILDGRERY